MSELRQAAQQALQALNMMRDEAGDCTCPACAHADAAVYAIEQALTEPEHEPISLNDGRLTMYPDGGIGVGTPSGIEAAHGIKEQEP